MKFLADFLSCYSGSVNDNNSPKIEACSLVQVTCQEEKNTKRARKLTRRNSSSKGLWQPSLYTISENDTIKPQEGIKASTKKRKSYRPKNNSQACYYNDLRVQAQFQTSIMALSAVTWVF
ncbi:uncharacterized protein LOC129874935 [Solanum dulcamara]|uniref:uncharacterized protein LOC129874935 n=1 Tax=Solanum dulcamara TaxID=45834 RepID=UPI0024865E96|nr:uncharacterized protein LOC129874935 [Solanum dulcamara]